MRRKPRKRDGGKERRLFRGDLSYRKTHRAVHSASAFISFPRIHRFIAFHLYTPYLENPRYRRLGISIWLPFKRFFRLSDSFPVVSFSRCSAFSLLTLVTPRTCPHHHRFRSLVRADKGPASTTLVNHG